MNILMKWKYILILPQSSFEGYNNPIFLETICNPQNCSFFLFLSCVLTSNTKKTVLVGALDDAKSRLPPGVVFFCAPEAPFSCGRGVRLGGQNK